MSEWISVEDRLPQHNQIVLAVGKSGQMEVVIEVLRCDRGLNNYVFMNPSLTRQITGITYWMPLPESPR